MKTTRIIAGLFFLAVASVAAFATYTKQNSRVTRMQFDVVYSNAGNVTAVNTSAFLASRFVNDSDATDQVAAPTWGQANFDLLDASLASTSITAAGKTVTYPQLAALLRQAALDRANAAGIQ